MNAPSFQCHVCGYRFRTLGNLTVHHKQTKRCKPKEQWLFPCSWCEKGFSAPDSYRRHCQQCHPDEKEEQKDHVCVTCHSVFENWFLWRAHVHRKHRRVLLSRKENSVERRSETG